MIGYVVVRLPQRSMREALRELEHEQGFDVPLSLVRRVRVAKRELELALPGAKVDLVSDEAEQLHLEVYGFADADVAERTARDTLARVDEDLDFLAYKEAEAVAGEAAATAAVSVAPASASAEVGEPTAPIQRPTLPWEQAPLMAEGGVEVEGQVEIPDAIVTVTDEETADIGEIQVVEAADFVEDGLSEDDLVTEGEYEEVEEAAGETALAIVPTPTALGMPGSSAPMPAEMSMLRNTLSDDHPLMAIAEALLRGRSSEHTRRTYAKDLRHFLRWCADNGVSPQHANRDHLIGYKDFLMGKYGGASPKRMMSVVRTLYSELEVRDMLPGRNPALRLPKVETKPSELPPALTLSQAKEMLRLIAAERHMEDLDSRELLTLRDIAIIKLLLTTGARRGAVVGSKVGDLQIKRGYPILFIRTKGNKAFDVKMPVDTYQALQDYLEAMENHGLPLQEEDPLFVELGIHLPSKISGLEATGLWAMVRRRLRLIGVDAPGTGVHYFRASHITLAHEGGADLYTIASSVGHSDTRMTQHYIRRADRLKHGSSDHVNL